jgi:DNA-directed RNA polymerase subunit RPC12/RpoP
MLLHLQGWKSPDPSIGSALMTDERAGCPGCSSQSKEYAREGWAGKHYLRALKWAWKWRRKFYRAVNMDFCPFCDDGEWEKTTTAGLFKCNHCGSHALDGRPTEARRIV